MKIVVHIGPHKTATTSLQVALSKVLPRNASEQALERERFASKPRSTQSSWIRSLFRRKHTSIENATGAIPKCNIVYPESMDGECPYNHSNIANRLLGINGYEQDSSYVNEQIEMLSRHFDSIIYSAEDFSKDVVNNFAGIEAAFKGRGELGFLITHRRFSLRAPGLLQEIAFHELPNSRGIETRPWEVISHPACRIDYAPLLANRFPDSEICIADLEKSPLDDAVVRFFSEFVRIPLTEKQEVDLRETLTVRHNTRKSDFFTEALNNIKKVPIFSSSQNWPKARSAIIDLLDNFSDEHATANLARQISPIEMDAISMIDQYERLILKLTIEAYNKVKLL